MPLSGKVDDLARSELTGLGDKHPAGLHQFLLAGFFVSFEILREGIAELQGNAAAHDAHTIHRVNDRFRFVFQYVTVVVRAAVRMAYEMGGLKSAYPSTLVWAVTWGRR